MQRTPPLFRPLAINPNAVLQASPSGASMAAAGPAARMFAALERRWCSLQAQGVMWWMQCAAPMDCVREEPWTLHGPTAAAAGRWWRQAGTLTSLPPLPCFAVLKYLVALPALIRAS